MSLFTPITTVIFFFFAFPFFQQQQKQQQQQQKKLFSTQMKDCKRFILRVIVRGEHKPQLLSWET